MVEGEPGITARKVDAGRTALFYRALPIHRDFADVVEPRRYVALPADWRLGLADVVTSTAAIAAGRYKVVNTAGAAVISAVSNALGTLDFPFVFTGDGASFAVGPDAVAAAGEALAATLDWVGSELGLAMRGALVPVASIRAAGADLRIARFAASADVDYAMFTGGGRDWAERELKAGRLAPPQGPAGARPDLTGLSCRFSPIKAAHGVILSVIVKQVGDDAKPFSAVVGDVLAIARRAPRSGHPVPPDGPRHRWPPAGLGVEARLQRPAGRSLAYSRASVAARSLLADLLFWTGRPFRGFDPAAYGQQLVANSDFRKFDDGLLMTLDCPPMIADAIAARLAAAEAEGVVRYGLHRQSEALVTCVVPSASRVDHVHFVDGAAGGYAMAARDLKAKLA